MIESVKRGGDTGDAVAASPQESAELVDNLRLVVYQQDDHYAKPFSTCAAAPRPSHDTPNCQGHVARLKATNERMS
jgi:hypothetical protein